MEAGQGMVLDSKDAGKRKENRRDDNSGKAECRGSKYKVEEG